MRTEGRIYLAPVGDRGSVLASAFNEAGNPFDVREVNIRPDLGRLVARIALRDLCSTLDEPGGERLGDALLHEQPGAGKTYLACVVILLDRKIDGEVEVGVVEDDGRALAAELE